MQVELRVQSNGKSKSSTTEIPEWLDDDFLQLCMQNGEGDPTIRVINYTVTGATRPSRILSEWVYHVTVRYKRRPRSRNILDFKPEETRQLVIKALPKAEDSPDDIQEAANFAKETSMLTNTLPAIGKLLGVSTLAPHCLYAEKSTPALIVLEDLSSNDYISGRMGRQRGLDFNHCALAMQAIARLHAGSIAIHEKVDQALSMMRRKLSDNALMDQYRDSLWCRQDPTTITEIVNRAVIDVADEVSTWPSYGEKYADKIRSLKDTLLPRVTAAISRDASTFNVLNHGNCWYRNLRFRYDATTERVEDITFVDFRHSVFASPAVDIQYFLSSTPTDEVRQQNFNRLLQHYHGTLVKTMEKLNTKTKPPSKEDLAEEIDKRGIYGVLVALTLLPIIVSDEATYDPEIYLLRDAKGFEAKRKMYSSEQFKASLKRLLPFFDSKGYLD